MVLLVRETVTKWAHWLIWKLPEGGNIRGWKLRTERWDRLDAVRMHVFAACTSFFSGWVWKVYLSTPLYSVGLLFSVGISPLRFLQFERFVRFRSGFNSHQSERRVKKNSTNCWIFTTLQSGFTEQSSGLKKNFPALDTHRTVTISKYDKHVGISKWQNIHFVYKLCMWLVHIFFINRRIQIFKLKNKMSIFKSL